MAAGRLTWPRSGQPVRQFDNARLFRRRRDAVVLGTVALVIVLVPISTLISTWPRAIELWGHDFNLYLDAAARWLGGGPYYPAEQLTGPVLDDGNRILYPPTALWLFGPLAMLPRAVAAVLWWVFPIGALVFQARRLRPQPIAWPFLALCVAWPPTVLTIVVWNSAPLFVGLLALGTLYRWPSALIFLKPSVLPFAFWGANRRSWWRVLAVLVVLSLPFGSLWLEWLQVVGNSHPVGGIWHSIQQFPMFFIPLIVWIGRAQADLAPALSERALGDQFPRVPSERRPRPASRRLS
jgi:hypothetical protein